MKFKFFLEDKRILFIALILLNLFIYISIYNQDFSNNNNALVNNINIYNDDFIKPKTAAYAPTWEELFTSPDVHGDHFRDIVIDSNGDICVTGEYWNESSSSNDVLIAKYDNAGNLQWNKTWGTTNHDYGLGIAVDSEDNLYVTGQIDSSPDDVILLEYSSSGNFMWNETVSGVTDGCGYAVDVYISGTASLDDIYITGYTRPDIPARKEVFVSRYKGDKTFLWTRTWGTDISYEEGFDIVVNENTNYFFVAGRTQSYSSGGYDALVMKYGVASGNLVDNETWGGINNDAGYGIELDSSGNVYVVGVTEDYGSGSGSNWLLIKFDSNLNEAWYRAGQIDGHETAREVVIESGTNDIYFTGKYQTGSNPTDLILVKYDSSGIFQWWNYWGEPGTNDYGRGMGIDSAGAVYVGGTTTSYGASGEDGVLLKFVSDTFTPMITINSQDGDYYKDAPEMDVDFWDDIGLHSAYYKVDDYTPLGNNTSGWTEIFSCETSHSYSTDFTMNVGVWGPLSEGTHTVYFKVWDDGFNVNDGASHSWQFYKDTNEPTITVVTSDGIYYKDAPDMDVDFTDAYTLDSAYYKVDDSNPPGTDTTGWTEIFSNLGGNSYTTDIPMDGGVFGPLNEGTHTVYFKAWDDAGNVNDGALPAWQFFKDTKAPTITIDIGHVNGSYHKDAPLMDVDFTDTHTLDDGYYRINSYTPTGTTITGWEEIFTNWAGNTYTTDIQMNTNIWNLLPEGSNTVYFKTWDDIENINDGQYPYWQFFKDTTEPEIQVNTPNGKYYNATTVPRIDIDFSDVYSLDSAYYKIDSATPEGTATTGWIEIFFNANNNSFTHNFKLDSTIFDTLDNKSHTVYFKVWDDLGNINDGISPSWQFYKGEKSSEGIPSLLSDDDDDDDDEDFNWMFFLFTQVVSALIGASISVIFDKILFKSIKDKLKLKNRWNLKWKLITAGIFVSIIACTMLISWVIFFLIG